ncbi:MAG: Succinate dehydrogenase, hydrophobic membrane anchor protein [uncultured Thiotrichaceae bacterium]|uniref:Succinate dehydrogenase hydrophobic membrane anchor subunit n=1 Tax=uncultured Thiotrichaceae bacterium TaxID=298394 RepID=A0A6S6SJB4_9GAMM|nr:MAG: Succinate dehydrogenase, hydrophobic membrane anchor protein [uncultured Thiotrichaceae bacterium]
MKDLRSPLAKVKGLGASGDATHHFWVQRLTALALFPLVIWLSISIIALPDMSYEALVALFQNPFNAVMMIVLVLVSLHHGHLGMQVIFEDYISTHGTRLAAILVTKFLSYFLMALGVYSVLKIALAG